jgi:DNA-binding response OmpR family regulator
MSETKTESKEGLVSIGQYIFDFHNQSLTIAGNTKRITGKETEILKYLSDHRNHVIKREALLKALWGENDYFLGRSLDVFITKIRRYLKEDPALSIENVFGVGFIFNVPAEI